MLEDLILNEQRKLDIIQSWLSDTTEPFDDWDYDGKELVLFLNKEVIERYSEEDLKEIIEDF